MKSHATKVSKLKRWNHLTDLFEFRLHKYLNEIGKYGRLVMNDHFSMIIMIILAFSVLYYRQLLLQIESLKANHFVWLINLFLVMILAFLVKDRQLLWLTHQSDASFLFAKGKEWLTYWLKGLIPLIISSISIILINLVLFPIFKVTSSWAYQSLWFIIICQLGMHWLLGLHHWLNSLTGKKFNNYWRWFIVYIFISLLVFLPKYQLIISIIILSGLTIFAAIRWLNAKKETIDFEYVISQEQKRMTNFYRWISIFAEVPQLKSAAKRRFYLDGFIHFLSTKVPNRYFYIYIRHLMRQQEYSGIWLRITLFIGGLLVFVQSSWLKIFLVLLALLMTAVQLFPLIFVDNYVVFQRIYPVRTSPVKPFQIALRVILYLQIMIFGIICIDIVLILIWILTSELIINVYFPWWYQRNKLKFKGDLYE